MQQRRTLGHAVEEQDIGLAIVLTYDIRDCRLIRAECCDTCHTYRKILYQEEDGNIEPVADDLASLALDLLLSEAGYRRGSANPLLLSAAE